MRLPPLATAAVLVALGPALTPATTSAATFEFRVSDAPRSAAEKLQVIGRGGSGWSAAPARRGPGWQNRLQQWSGRGRLMRDVRYGSAVHRDEDRAWEETPDLALAPDGSLYTSDRVNGLAKRSATGRVVRGWAADPAVPRNVNGVVSPQDMAVDGRGRLTLVVDSGVNSDVLQLDRAGRLIRRLAVLDEFTAIRALGVSRGGKVALLVLHAGGAARLLAFDGAGARVGRGSSRLPLKARDLAFLRERLVVLHSRAADVRDLAVVSLRGNLLSGRQRQVRGLSGGSWLYPTTDGRLQVHTNSISRPSAKVIRLVER